MSNKPTWADVAPYYAKNHTQIGVYLAAHHTGTATFCACDREYFLTCADADDLPELADLEDITEEDAQVLVDMAKIKPMFEGVWTARELLLDIRSQEGMKMSGSLMGLVLGQPAAFHYLIQRNYNVFNVPTYKGANP